MLSKLEKYGFKNGNYTKVIVTWGWTSEAKDEADREGIILWDFREILKEIAESCRDKKTYFTDDTLRTIHLFIRSIDENSTVQPKNHITLLLRCR